jgi:hypothetical protein
VSRRCSSWTLCSRWLKSSILCGDESGRGTRSSTIAIVGAKFNGGSRWLDDNGVRVCVCPGVAKVTESQKIFFAHPVESCACRQAIGTLSFHQSFERSGDCGDGARVDCSGCTILACAEGEQTRVVDTGNQLVRVIRLILTGKLPCRVCSHGDDVCKVRHVK